MMETLNFEQMEQVNGGSKFISVACDAITAGSVVYGFGVLANWWNPIGWVSAVGIAGSLACAVFN